MVAAPPVERQSQRSGQVSADAPVVRGFQPPTNRDIERVEARLLSHPQVDMPLVHRFAPGVYLREIFMPKGAFVIGHQHKTEHFNIVLRGCVSVLMDGKVIRIDGPCTFTSGPGVRKCLYIHEDTVWQTIHPTVERDLDRLEEMLIVKSASFQRHDLEAAAKKLAIEVEAYDASSARGS